VDKSSDAFRTISEVAGDLDLPQHVLRFWETRFAQIKPLKRGGGRRYYRPDDVELLKGIRHLLYGEGYTIKGVQRILKDQGVRFVMAIWQEGAPGVDPNSRTFSADDHDDFDPQTADQLYGQSFDQADADDDVGHGSSGPIELPAPPLRSGRADERGHSRHGTGARSPQSPLGRAQETDYGSARTVSIQQVSPNQQSMPQQQDDGGSPESIAQRFAPAIPVAPRAPITAAHQVRGRSEQTTRGSGQDDWSPQPRQQPFAPMIDRFRGMASRLSPDTSSRALMAGAGSTGNEEPAGGQGLSRDDVRRLQATLFELLECKRLLDQTR
jgi:DNA-binding transcriptional MerR regulator